MEIKKEISEYQRIANTMVANLSEAELEFYLCVAKGNKGCNIGKPNDLFTGDDGKFIHIQKNFGHPGCGIKHFDLMSINARDEEHKKYLKEKYEKQYWHCWIDATGMKDKDGNRIPCNTHATMYRPSGDIKSEWDDWKEWGNHRILDSIPEQDKKTISFEGIWNLIKV